MVSAALVMSVPVKVGAVTCGNGWEHHYADGAARAEAIQRNVDDFLGRRHPPEASINDRCDDAMWTRRYIAIPLGAIGVLLGLGGLLVDGPRNDEPTAEETKVTSP